MTVIEQSESVASNSTSALAAPFTAFVEKVKAEEARMEQGRRDAAEAAGNIRRQAMVDLQWVQFRGALGDALLGALEIEGFRIEATHKSSTNGREEERAGIQLIDPQTRMALLVCYVPARGGAGEFQIDVPLGKSRPYGGFDDGETLRVLDSAQFGRGLAEAVDLLRTRAREQKEHAAQSKAEAEAQERKQEQRRQAEIAEREASEATKLRRDYLLERKKAEAWTWPDGVSVTLYRMRWVRAATVVEDEGPQFDYEEIWSLQDKPDAEGWIQTAGGRRLRFSSQYYDVEERIVSSFDALPLVLKELATTRVTRFREVNGQFNSYVWVEDPEAEETISLGYQPIEQIRRAIDEAAGRQKGA